MGDYCKQCSIELFNKDYGDMACISTSVETDAKLYPIVVCEGCGKIQVDHLGNCVSNDCLKKGHNETV